MAIYPLFKNLKNIDCYLTDERNVPSDHPDSNGKMLKETLFKECIPENSNIFYYKTDIKDEHTIASLYANHFPESIDVLLLSIGEDEHIASIFPGSAVFNDKSTSVLYTIGSRQPYERFTNTPKVIKSAEKIYALCIGEQKKVIFEKVKFGNYSGRELPAMIVNQATWVVSN